MTCRAVFFDLDGTLVDSNELHVDAWAIVFAEAGHTIERSAIHGEIGKGGDKLVPALLPAVDATEREQLSNRHGDVFRQRCIDEVKPFAQAHALLAAVHARGIRIVLASSASKAGTTCWP